MADSGETLIKGYRINQLIGSGPTGVVYQARHVTTGRPVALKMIHPSLAAHPDFIRHFEPQTQRFARLDHRAIVPLQDYWRDADGTFLVTRLLPGNLRKTLEHSPLPLETAALVLDQLAAALDFAHRQGIVHRTLKPENILFDEDDYPYLTDFGITPAPPIQSGDRNGAPRSRREYRAPEQIRGEAAAAHSDLYTLGLILYEMLTGRCPFSDSVSETAHDQRLNHTLPPLDQFSAPIAQALTDVLQRATAAAPADRFPNAGALSEAFHAATNLKARSDRQLADRITARELEILQLIVDGKSNSEIARDLVIELTTVKWHVKQLYEKMQVHKRQQAIHLARELKLVAFADNHAAVHPARADKVAQEAAAHASAGKFVHDNPYKGLQPFQITDSSNFFGREKTVQYLLEKLAEVNPAASSGQPDFGRFLAIIGSSGSGKSSLVRAGLIPALWRGELPGSADWFVADMVPGSHPLAELAGALARIAPNFPRAFSDQITQSVDGLLQVTTAILPDDGRELLLFVDQFEEVFTLTGDECERTHFLNSMLSVVTHPASRVRLIITLRADFFDRPLEYREFGLMLRSRLVTLLPMSPEELEQAIVQPARQVGVEFEGGLVAEIIAAVNSQPGALPLLEYALTELFKYQTLGLLSHQAYFELGGVIGALSKHADTLYAELSPAQQHAAQQLFLRLVTLGEGVEDTRRRVLYSELLAIAPESDTVDELIDLYTAQRLLSIDRDPLTREPTVELAHEALLRRWGKLRDWLAESRADLRIQRQLMAAATEWDWNGRSSSDLASRGRLAAFDALMNGSNLRLSAIEQAYVQASVQELEKQARAQADQQLRLVRLQRTRIVLLSISLMIAIGLSAIALLSRMEAVLQTQTAVARQLAAQALADLRNPVGNDEYAALLAIRALNVQYDPVADGALVEAAARLPLMAFSGHTAEVYDVKFSPDDRYVLTGSGDGTARLWDAVTGQPIRTFEVAGAVYAVDFSPDGAFILTGSEDHAVRLWETASGQLLRTFTGHEGGVDSGVFSPDGTYVLSRSTEDGTARLWEVSSGNQIRIVARDGTRGVAFSPDGNTLLVSDVGNDVTLTETTTGRLLATLRSNGNAIYALAFSPDGKYILTGSVDNSATLWETASAQAVYTLRGHSSSVRAVAFSPDGKSIVTGSSDYTLRLWDTATGQELHRFRAHSGRVWSVAFSGDGRRIVSASADHSVKLWDAVTDAGFAPLGGSQHEAYDVAISPSGNLALIARADGTTEMLDIHSREEVHPLIGHTGTVYSVAFSPDGTQVLTGSADGTARLWDTASGRELRAFSGHTAGILGAAFSPDGQSVLTGSEDATAKLWDAGTGREIRTFTGHAGGISGVAFSPDGVFILTAGADGKVSLMETASGNTVRTFAGEAGVFDARFSPDGKHVLTGSADGAVSLWDAASGAHIRTFSGTTNSVYNVAFSADGRYVAAGSAGRTAIIWETATGTVVRVLRGHDAAVWGIAFSPDGRFVLTGSLDHTVRLWHTGYRDFVESVCARLLRDFTDQERELIPITDDEATCLQFTR
jgi:WD40 repeat protein/serine/threonine protein kinase